MNESFEYRPLLDRDTLRVLQQRQDFPSLVRLILHLGRVRSTYTNSDIYRDSSGRSVPLYCSSGCHLGNAVCSFS